MKKKYIIRGIIVIIGIIVYVIWANIKLAEQKEKDRKFTVDCMNDSIAHIRNGDITIYFNSEYEELSKQGIEIKHISKGKVIDNVKYKQRPSGAVAIYDFRFLLTDSIEITFKGNEKLYLHSFENGVRRVSRKQFIGGCHLQSFNTSAIGKLSKKNIDPLYVFSM